MNTIIELNSLISLADEILNNSNPDEIVDKLEKYAESFNAWYAAYEKSLAANQPINSKLELEQLLIKHEKVAEISESLKDSIPEEISKLKHKGRGIMAYTDLLPKKISFTKPTKG